MRITQHQPTLRKKASLLSLRKRVGSPKIVSSSLLKGSFRSFLKSFFLGLKDTPKINNIDVEAKPFQLPDPLFNHPRIREIISLKKATSGVEQFELFSEPEQIFRANLLLGRGGKRLLEVLDYELYYYLESLKEVNFMQGDPSWKNPDLKPFLGPLPLHIERRRVEYPNLSRNPQWFLRAIIEGENLARRLCEEEVPPKEIETYLKKVKFMDSERSLLYPKHRNFSHSKDFVPQAMGTFSVAISGYGFSLKEALRMSEEMYIGKWEVHRKERSLAFEFLYEKGVLGRREKTFEEFVTKNLEKIFKFILHDNLEFWSIVEIFEGVDQEIIQTKNEKGKWKKSERDQLISFSSKLKRIVRELYYGFPFSLEALKDLRMELEEIKRPYYNKMISTRKTVAFKASSWPQNLIKKVVSDYHPVHRAIFNQNEGELRKLIADGYRLNTKVRIQFKDGSNSSVTPLLLAESLTNERMKEILIKAGGLSMAGASTFAGQRIVYISDDFPLHKAVASGDIEQVQKMIDQGHPLHGESPIKFEGWKFSVCMNILDIACALPTYKMEKYLLETLDIRQIY